MSTAPRRSRSGAPDIDSETVVWTHLHEHTVDGSPWRGLLVPPTRFVRLLALSRRLPRVVVRLSDTAVGCAVRDQLRIAGTGRALLGGLTSALQIPEDSRAYMEGASKQTVRRKERAALKAAVTYHVVTDPQERSRLAAIADLHERDGARTGYRTQQPDNHDLPAYDLWIAAHDGAGTPLMLCVAPIDGSVATLRYFRTLQSTSVASDTRYLMTRVLVDELARRGVRHLIDTAGVQWLSPGLRHFQRMLGFRLLRLSVHPGRRLGHHPGCPLA